MMRVWESPRTADFLKKRQLQAASEYRRRVLRWQVVSAFAVVYLAYAYATSEYIPFWLYPRAKITALNCAAVLFWVGVFSLFWIRVWRETVPIVAATAAQKSLFGIMGPTVVPKLPPPASPGIGLATGFADRLKQLDKETSSVGCAVGSVSGRAAAATPTPPKKSSGAGTGTPVPTQSPQRHVTPNVHAQRLLFRDRIADDKALHEFLDEQASRDQVASALLASPSTPTRYYGYSSPTQVATTYRASPPSTPPTLIKAGDDVHTPHADHATPGSALLQDAGGVSTEATQGLRVYVCSRVLKPLVEAWDRTKALFARAAAAPPTWNPPAPSSSFGALGGGMGASSMSTPTAGVQRPLSIHEYMAKYPSDPVVRERQMLERYLKVGKGEHMEYVLGRIRDLSSESWLPSFQYRGGGPFRGRDWTPDLPSDPQIVLHMLVTYLDAHYQVRAPGSPSFSARHVAVAPESPMQKPGPAVLFEEHGLYKVWVAGRVMEVAPGRSNLFHAILIFLYHMKMRFAKDLGPLADPPLGLVNLL